MYVCRAQLYDNKINLRNTVAQLTKSYPTQNTLFFFFFSLCLLFNPVTFSLIPSFIQWYICWWKCIYHSNQPTYIYIHNIFTVCHGVAIHHRFNYRTSPFPNFAMISIDSASFSNRRSHLRLEVVGAILWPNCNLSLCGYGFGRNLRRI